MYRCDVDDIALNVPLPRIGPFALVLRVVFCEWFVKTPKIRGLRTGQAVVIKSRKIYPVLI